LIHLLETYLQDIALVHASGAGVKELSFYPALAGLLSEVGKTLKPKVRCVSQLKSLGAGMPDFGLFTADQFQHTADADPLPGQKPGRGVIEVKGPASDLDALIKTSQVQGYVQEYGLVLLTNLREFALAGSDPHGPLILERCAIAESETVFWQAASHAHKTANQHSERLVEFLKRALTHAAPIFEPKDLAWLLASYAREARLRVEQAGDLPALGGLRAALEQSLGIQFSGEKGEHFFRSTLVQTLFYGIFAAWVLWHERKPAAQPDAPFDWRLSTYYLQVPVLQALFYQISNPAQLKPLGLTEVLEWSGAALNRVDETAFFARFERVQAVQYFYEPFLEAYDPQLRKDLGVWYTPPEIVRYMVERVDRVLRTELGLADGLAAPEVVVLDPCCGTGAYPLEVLRRIAQTLREKGETALLAHDLKTIAQTRVFGFELLPAPFVIAHLQIGLFLQNYGAALEEGERAGVFLTNALTGWDPAQAQPKLPLPELAAERDAAVQVKQKAPILVILGNPPYNAFAGVAQAGEEKDLVQPYKQGLVEQWGIKKFNLDDLYVRFFRLAERAIAEHSGRGVVCFISNYSWLNGPSFVVLRQHLLKNFDRFWIENLHGDRKISEYAPDGRTSETVFAISGFSPGIQQGVAISLWVRSAISQQPQVWLRDDLSQAKAEERRAALLDSLNAADFATHYQLASPSPANRFSFRPQEVSADYMTWPKVVELCAEGPYQGLSEDRRKALIDVDKTKLSSRMQLYFDRNLSWNDLLAAEGPLTESYVDFPAPKVRELALKTDSFDQNNLRRYAMRPLDTQFCYFTGLRPIWRRHRPEFHRQAWEGNKFLVTRFKCAKDPEGASIAYINGLCDYHYLAPNAGAIPFRVKHAAPQNPQMSLFSTPIETITANLSAPARIYLQSLTLDPETHFDAFWLHALAIGYSPVYLSENADGIRQDWPRIPLPDSQELLLASAALGQQVAALLDTEAPVSGVTQGSLPPDLKMVGTLGRVGGGQLHPEQGDLALTAGWGHRGKEGVTMPGKGRTVERSDPNWRVVYDVYLNEIACWQNIPATVWDFTIGGYQVIKKWLSYREHGLLGRDLTVEEARYVTEMARRLAALVRLQPELDTNYHAVRGAVYPWHGEA